MAAEDVSEAASRISCLLGEEDRRKPGVHGMPANPEAVMHASSWTNLDSSVVLMSH
jgi:hypothetical protein